MLIVGATIPYVSTDDSRLHVVNFSGGLCSFWAAWRVKERYGNSHMVLLFADTLIEDPDLYAFNNQASAPSKAQGQALCFHSYPCPRAGRQTLLGVPITRISREEDPWSLFRRQGLIGNSRFPICSVMLKREPLDEWHQAHCRDRFQDLQSSFWDDGRSPATIYLGFDWTEEKRLNDLRAELSQWDIEAPMTEAPIWDKCRMESEARKLGLPIPRLYGLGFPHNNCGGRCVRAGISHFVHLYWVLRERFIEWRDEETATRKELERRGIEPFSILKDRRGGTVKPLWLSDLQLRIESGEKFAHDEWGGCGCGGATQELVEVLGLKA